jgi:hypothetical protein
MLWRLAYPLLCGGSQPIPVTQVVVSVVENPMSSLVAKFVAEVAEKDAKKGEKDVNARNHNDTERTQKATLKRTMKKWFPYMSSFILEKMCELIKGGVTN